MNKRCKCQRCKKCEYKTESHNNTMVEIETRPVPTIEIYGRNENKYFFYRDGRVEPNLNYPN